MIVRTRKPAAEQTAASEQGFVLIGVVIIVLALTILGISLFGLSGYEAQFLGASTNGSRAFYAALGGIDRAKLALSARSDLGQAAINLPPGVIYTRAMQGPDSTGDLDWADTTHIEIVATAEVNGVRRSIEASFLPNRDRTLYTDLIATTGQLYVREDPFNSTGDPILRSLNFLNGKLRHNDVSNAWDLPPVLGINTDEGGGVPAPQIADYFSNWGPFSAGAPPYNPGSPNVYRFDVPHDGYAHFTNGDPGPAGGFGLYNSNGQVIEFRVSGGGTAVWMLPNGARFDQRVTVTGSSSDRLVIVAGISTNTEYVPRVGVNTGIWFNGGLHSPTVPVFLVSSGTVAIEHVQNPLLPDDVGYLSVFASAFLLARQIPGVTVLSHNAALDDDVLNRLYDDGLLPNTIPGRGQDFIPIAGSWRELPQ